MPPTVPTFDEYRKSLSRFTIIADPTQQTEDTQVIQEAAKAIEALPALGIKELSALIQANPSRVPALGLAVGLGQEKLRNALKEHLDTSGWITLAKTEPELIIEMLDGAYDLVSLLHKQRNNTYSFGDLLVARAGSRVTAGQAVNAGQVLEDKLVEIAVELGLQYDTQTRFVGRGNADGPCDLVLPAGGEAAQIVVAAKVFDSTGSKLTAAREEIRDLANIRKPTQYVFAAIDGIGWNNRQADLRKIHELWVNGEIDGMYTLNTLPAFRTALKQAAERLQLI